VRNEILELLRSNDHISGEVIASRLNISRAAVWKHIKALRAKGYLIDSSPGYGYTLIKSTEKIVPEEITSGLNTSVIGKKVLCYDEVTSTQDIADKLARSGTAEGTIIIAKSQSMGRGRKRRTWISGSNGIYLSIILRPQLKPGYVVQIPMVIGVALVKAINNVTGLNARIKWPNDIIVNSKKVAGILTEMSSEMDRVNYVITGIGINLNTDTSGFPDEIRATATSLKEEAGHILSGLQLIRAFLEELDKAYETYIKEGFPSVSAEWKNLNNTIGSNVRVYDGEIEILGRALDIDDEGFLIIVSESGSKIRILSGDVSLRHR